MVAAPDDYDPFALFTRPPPNETAGERAVRERQEAEAKKRSDAIDEELRKEKAKMKKDEKRLVRVLLLGQSESGKSTTLKNFRIRYAQEEWKAELAGWRTVIQLNLLKSVITILDALQAEQDNEPTEDPPYTAFDGEAEYLSFDSSLATPSQSATIATTPNSHPSISNQGPNRVNASSGGSNLRRELVQASATTSTGASSSSGGTGLSGKHQLLKLRLAPLRRVEEDLRRRLGAGAEEEAAEAAAAIANWDGDDPGPLGNITNGAALTGPLKRQTTREFSVRRLKDALNNSQSQVALGNGTSPTSSRGHGRVDSDGEKVVVDEATEIIATCLDDIKSLWMDETLKTILKKRKIRLEDSAGFFLDDLDRIAKRDYVPSDGDVVRSRLRTLGVQEYRIKTDQAPGLTSSLVNFGSEWLLYDVGGSRTTRNAWIPYFENIHAIIFLAPLSCFDERLLEDSRVNRLEDSFLLWRTVCGSRLLKKASLILFMNKCDLLKRKLKQGVKVKNYLPSYGDRPNDAGTVVKYLKEKFKDLNRSYSVDHNRSTYYYATSVTDTKTTAITLIAVKDIILREHLKNADFV